MTRCRRIASVALVLALAVLCPSSAPTADTEPVAGAARNPGVDGGTRVGTRVERVGSITVPSLALVNAPPIARSAQHAVGGPTTLALVGFGLLGLGFLVRRRMFDADADDETA